MGEENLRKGPWYEEEDERLKAFVAVLGARRWDSVARISGLMRSGKSCRLRWLNYLRPYLKHGAMTPQEEQIILGLHERWGNKWAKIARRLPGRTDNEVKNYWRTYLRKKEQIQNSLLLHRPTSSPFIDVSSSETSSSSDQTNNGQTSTKLSSNINNDDNNKEFADELNNNGAMIMDGFADCDDYYQKGLSDYVITNSPYENRLSDWIKMLSEEQSDKYSEDAVEEYCLDDPMTWSYGDGINAWDFPDMIWDDMDLFNGND
ncbi:Transcription factor MYB27 [Bienertia sinuspersici]